MSKNRVTLTFFLHEKVTPDIFAMRVIQNAGAALRPGEGIELPSDPNRVLLRTEEKPAPTTLDLLELSPQLVSLAKSYALAKLEYHKALSRYLQCGGTESKSTRRLTKLYKGMVGKYEDAMRRAERALVEQCNKETGTDD